MATVRHQIAEHDVVALREPVDAWPVGTSGTVVSDYGKTKLIEISDDSGATLDLIQAPLAMLDVTWRAAQH
jgi:hypothetical protein